MACSSTNNNNIRSQTFNNVRNYFSNKEGTLYVSVEKNDKLHSVHEFDIKNKSIIRCNYDNNLSSNVNPNCEKFHLVSPFFPLKTDDKYENVYSKSCNLDSLISSYEENFLKIDSANFWKEVSGNLDSSIFILPYHMKLLDFTFSNKKVDQKLLVSRADFVNSDDEIDLSKVPTLFFDVTINGNGNIIGVDYNSWGQSIYESLIIDLKRYLLTKSIEPYRIMSYQVTTKLTIGVAFADRI